MTAARTVSHGYHQATRCDVGAILVNVAPDTLYLQMTPAGAEAGADVLSYANAPSNVSDSLGRFLGAFAGFPL